MDQNYLNEVMARLDSPASLFIGSIILACLLVGLFKATIKAVTYERCII